MKNIITFSLQAFVLLLLVASKECRAQQTEPVNYTYKVFQAPNKNFGYDIYRNGIIVYHEFASMSQPENFSQPKNPSSARLNASANLPISKENLALMKSTHAEKAAQLSIAKIKRHEMPVLNRDEIKSITAQ
jgi:hypothetical protein